MGDRVMGWFRRSEKQAPRPVSENEFAILRDSFERVLGKVKQFGPDDQKHFSIGVAMAISLAEKKFEKQGGFGSLPDDAKRKELKAVRDRAEWTRTQKVPGAQAVKLAWEAHSYGLAAVLLGDEFLVKRVEQELSPFYKQGLKEALRIGPR